MKNDANLIRANVDMHDRMVQEIEKACPGCDFETQAFFQPLPSVVARHAIEQGGDVLGLDGNQDNAVILLASVAVKDEKNEKLARAAIMKWKRASERYGQQSDGLLPFIYMNYADGSQDVIKHYGNANAEKLRKVAGSYDPNGVLQKRVPGGFKIPR